MLKKGSRPARAPRMKPWTAHVRIDVPVRMSRTRVEKLIKDMLAESQAEARRAQAGADGQDSANRLALRIVYVEVTV